MATQKEIYTARMEKATAHLRKVKVPEMKSKDETGLSAAVQKATASALSVIMQGLANDLTAITKKGGPETHSEVNSCFTFANEAARSIFGMADIKSGRAGWLTYAMKGLKEPKEKPEDTWISGLGRH